MFPSELFHGTLFEEDLGLDFSGVVVKVGPPVSPPDPSLASRPPLKGMVRRWR